MHVKLLQKKCLLFCFVVVFLRFVQKHIIFHKILQFALQYCLFSILNILQDL